MTTIQYCKQCKTKEAIVSLTEGTWGASMKCSSCGLMGDGFNKDELVSNGGWSCDECFGNCDIHMFGPCYCPTGHPPCGNCTDAGLRCNDCGALFDREGVFDREGELVE